MSGPEEDGFSAAERDAIRQRAAELRAQADGSDGEQDVLTAIDQLPEEEQTLALAFHTVVREVAPGLVPRTWYGFPAYARPGRRGGVVCFFTSASKGGTRYHVVGFGDAAALDEGSLWPTSYALLRWTADNERELGALVARAAG
ncbi:DUF1801 domain-containing protein [Microlunatus lacustris]